MTNPYLHLACFMPASRRMVGQTEKLVFHAFSANRISRKHDKNPEALVISSISLFEWFFIFLH